LTGASQNSPDQPRAKEKPRDPLVGTILDDRFQIEEVIGTGGMSVVYKATQLRVNRHVAIKTLRLQLDAKPIYRERFQREISLLCSLSHPNIVTVYDCVIGADDQPYVIMDYLRGRSLEQLIDQSGPLSVDRFARIAVQVCSALDYAHRKGVIHRDLKPGNIVLMDEEMDFVKVVDFGLAKLNLDNRRLTQSGELWGSPPYMSPEQCTSKPEDERSDIYSFGAVMYEMLCGKDPFHNATTVFELIQTHVNTDPPKLAETNPLVFVPPRLEAVIFKAMAKDPKDRFQSGQLMRDAIVDACAESGKGSAGDLLLLPAEAKDTAAERWIKGAAAEQKPATASENFRLALDPMKGMSGVDQLLPPPGARLSDTTEYGAQPEFALVPPEANADVTTPGALGGSISEDRWRKPEYAPAPAVASAAANQNAAQIDPGPEVDLTALANIRTPAPLIKAAAAAPAPASASAPGRGKEPNPPMNARQALRNRELAAPKSNPIVMIVAVVVIFAAVVFGTNFFLHHNDAPATESLQKVPPDATPPSEKTDTTQTPSEKTDQAASDNHVNRPAVSNVGAEHNAPHLVHKPAHHTPPAVPVHAVPAHHTPPAVSPAAAHHASGKSTPSGKPNPWQSLDNMRLK